MAIIVFIKKEYFNLVSNLEKSYKALGIGLGIKLGNKGGNCVGFKILESSFLFLNCHLAAKPNKSKQRVEQYISLCENLRIGHSNIESIYLYDNVFFLGDMNFRIDLEFKKVVELVNNSDFKPLLKEDQLFKLKSTNQFLSLFQEAEIKFRPSYRRNRTDDFYSNKNEQSPSYTDRILFRNNKNNNVKCLEYDIKNFQMGSDHRPVYALFQVQINLAPFVDLIQIQRNLQSLYYLVFDDFEIFFEFQKIKDINYISKFYAPLKIKVHFYSLSLDTIQVSNEYIIHSFNDDIKFKFNQLPILKFAVSDFNIIQKQVLIISITAQKKIRDKLIGQSSIYLDKITLNQPYTQNEKISLLGNFFGLMITNFRIITNNQ